MTRLIEIYSRLNALDDLVKLMLQPPNIYREETIKAHIASLVAYVDHVNAVIWKQQERDRLVILISGILCPRFLRFADR
ncbi:TPA: hypothetical protein O7139_001250 [Salmonella enterica]|nr:hypothetical protein [Salmonella enterica]HDC2559343.1 hypothetical protein [Salmonella enterica]